MFHLPTRIFFGSGALQEASDHIFKLGSKALLVTGKHSAKASGALDDVTKLLQGFAIPFAHFDQVPQNPDLDTIMAGAQLLRQEQCDYVIAIGGGSPIDAAKAMALVAANSLQRSQIYRIELFQNALPLIAIPTTSGTGSEVTQYSVLTNPDTGIKAGFGHDLAFPRLAICDPVYTHSLDCEVSLNTALDALSHLLEGIYSNKRQALADPLIHGGARDIFANLKAVLENPAHISGREKLMRASLYGGITIAQGSTTLQHSLGYPLTSKFGTPHGLSNALVMLPVMKLFAPARKAELDALFAALNTDMDGFAAWLESLNLPPAPVLEDEFIAKSVQEVLGSRNMANNPLEVSAEQIRRIYQELR